MNKLNKAAAITNVVIIIIMTLLTHACYLKGKHAGADEIMSHIYPMSGIVTEVNHQEDHVIVTDSTGNKWEFNGIEDWQEGDIAAMVMDDNGTEEIYDDKIINIHYIGWIEQSNLLYFRCITSKNNSLQISTNVLYYNHQREGGRNNDQGY